MKRTVAFLFAVAVVAVATGFIGCSENPAGDNWSNNDSTSTSTPMFSLLESWQVNDSVWVYEVQLASRAFRPEVKDSVAMLGFKSDWSDWTNWRLGVIGRKYDGYWIFRVSTVTADKKINFCRGGNWAQKDSLKKVDYFIADSNGGGNLQIRFQKGVIGRAGMIPSQSITVVRDTVTIPGKTIRDTIKINVVTHDTIHVRDTVVNTVTVVKKDTVKIPGMTIYDTLRINTVTHDTIHVRDTVVNVVTIVKKDTLTIPGKTIVDTLRINQVTHDTIHVRDTLVITLTVVKVIRDTITLPGKVIVDTVKVLGVTDTIHVRDTIILSTTIIDKGTVKDTTKSFLRDTAWLDANQLSGVITEDTTIRVRTIHTVWQVAGTDTVIKRDTTLASPQITRYRVDTVSFVITQYGASKVGSDSVYRFGITAIAFAYSGKSDDSVRITGLDDHWTFVGKIGGYFVFDAKMVGGITYSLNFVGNKGTWAQQEVLLLSPLAVKSGSNCDIVCRVDGKQLIKP